MFLVPFNIISSKNYKKKLDAKNLENEIFEDKNDIRKVFSRGTREVATRLPKVI